MKIFLILNFIIMVFIIPEENVEVSNKDETHKVIDQSGVWLIKGTLNECESWLANAKASKKFKYTYKWKIIPNL